MEATSFHSLLTATRCGFNAGVGNRCCDDRGEEIGR
jgi:hypothetical protein